MPGGEDQSRNNNPSWLVRQWRRLRGKRRDGDTILAEVGEDARGVAVGKNIIQIGSLQIPIWLAVLVAAAVVIGAGIAVYNAVSTRGQLREIGGVVLAPTATPTPTVTPTATPSATPTPTPAPMTGAFNIAVADFGQEDAAGRVQPAEKGRVLSQWVYDSLRNQYGQIRNSFDLDVEIWHDSADIPQKNVTFGIMTGDTPQARAESAAALAQTVRADMVIYGQVTDAEEPAGLVLEFYVSPQLRETNTIVGRHGLGQPIPVFPELDNPLARISTNETLQTRIAALFRLTVGLTYDLLGRSQDALDTLRAAEAELTDWRDEDGKEILYFFIGRELLFLQRDEEAQEAFETALAINPDYARAHVGLGSVYLWRAQRIPPVERMQPPHDLQNAIDQYEIGRQLAAEQGEPLVELITRLASASAHRVQGETYNHAAEANASRDLYDQAHAAFEAAIGELEEILAPLADANQHRYLALAQQNLGAAYLQRADTFLRQGELTQRQESLEQARLAFSECIAQANAAPFDAILQERIAAGSSTDDSQTMETSCRAALEIVENALRENDQRTPEESTP
jgi:tetratricopeptide (TPR) repeat protein